MEERELSTPETLSCRLGFIKLVVRDLDSMVGFFERGLGFAVQETMELDHAVEKVMFSRGRAGVVALILYSYKDNRELSQGDSHGPLGFYVRDVDAAYAHALRNGALDDRAPYDTGGMRVAFVKTPEGHSIELLTIVR